MDLYGHPWSAPTREVRIVCAELGIDCKLVEVGRAQGDDYLPEALNPACRIPMLDDDGVVVGEAHAIVRYLVGRYAPGSAWYPADVTARAHTDQWLDWQALRLAPLAATLARARAFSPQTTDPAEVSRAQEFLGRILPELDRLLREQPFVGGPQPTLADIAIFTSLEYLQLAQYELGTFHAMFRWHQSFFTRESCSATALAQVGGRFAGR